MLRSILSYYARCSTSLDLNRSSSNYFLDLGFNFALRIDDGPVFQLLHSSTRFAGILGFKDDFQFFKRDAFGLDVKEIDEGKLEKIPEDEEDIEPIADLRSKSAFFPILLLSGSQIKQPDLGRCNRQVLGVKLTF
jgi:hypothetical protein